MTFIAAALSFGIVTAASAPTPQVPPVEPQNNLVVTGVQTGNYRRALEACLARHCPTNEDVDATLALAEALFVEGDYREARTTIRESLQRNRDQAAGYPEPVADLYRSNARVSRHLGFDREALSSTYSTLRALRTGLPEEDHRHFTARLEIVAALVASRQFTAADRELRELGEFAAAAGRSDVVALVDLRRVRLDYMQNRDQGSVRRLEAFAQDSNPENRLRSIGAHAMLVSIYSARRDTARADEHLAALGRSSQARQLLYAPTFNLLQNENLYASNARVQRVLSGGLSSATANLDDRMVGNFDDRWIDVGFWISGDGHVEDLNVLQGGSGNDGWDEPLLESIRGRRYSASANGERTYRLERYTFTSERRNFDVTGTHITQRSPRARVEYLDLTERSQAD
ncbi:MAG: hypothetical protein ACXWU2_09510 [Allosphingosinicella sp.]